MGSKERLARKKEKVRKDILDAAMNIVKSEGCRSLSMRKIAGTIEYSVPVVYSHFLNKEAIEIELAKDAHLSFNNYIAQRLEPVKGAEARFITIAKAFLEFTINEKELYQLIHATGVGIQDVKNVFPELSVFTRTMRRAMEDLIDGKKLPDDIFNYKYLTFVSLIMGLSSLNEYFKDILQDTNAKVIEDALSGIIDSIKRYAGNASEIDVAQ